MSVLFQSRPVIDMLELYFFFLPTVGQHQFAEIKSNCQLRMDTVTNWTMVNIEVCELYTG